MADPPKPPITVVIPPPLWALLFLVAAWGAGWAQGLAAAAWLEQPVAGALLAIAGAALAIWGRQTFARAGTEVMPVSPSNKVLVTEGPFRFTRNPMYLGLLFICAGITLIVGTLTMPAAPVVFFLFVNFISIPFEEAKMERQFGDAYRDYKKRARRWI
jgi:protein-S-isoprenylcysteine O-methyltransferase Ste14